MFLDFALDREYPFLKQTPIEYCMYPEIGEGGGHMGWKIRKSQACLWGPEGVMQSRGSLSHQRGSLSMTRASHWQVLFFPNLWRRRALRNFASIHSSPQNSACTFCPVACELLQEVTSLHPPYAQRLSSLFSSHVVSLDFFTLNHHMCQPCFPNTWQNELYRKSPSLIPFPRLNCSSSLCSLLLSPAPQEGAGCSFLWASSPAQRLKHGV